MVRTIFPNLTVVGSLYLATRPPHALAGALDDRVIDLVCPHISSRFRENLCAQLCPGITTFDELLDRVEQHIAEAVARMVAGDISACAVDAEACRWCPSTMCTRRLM